VYGTSFKYSKVTKATNEEVINYHKKYYVRENIIILEKDIKERDCKEI
jgi:Zn-dependent M16 (insulinase) family peptidase